MTVHRSSKTFTTRSVFGSAGLGYSGGLVMNGLGSSGASLSFGGQNYGRSEGYDARISRSWSTSSLTTADNEDALSANEKQTMQNLNDRLASYLERVRSLEQANKKLELQIKEFYDNKSQLERKDFSAYFKTISELRTQIHSRYMENTELRLKLDNTKLTTDDFHLKWQTEMNMRTAVEADSAQLRGVQAEIKLSIRDLENQLAGLKEELLYLKKNHEEELHLLRAKQGGSVNVEMDCVARSDLDMELQEMRARYEKLIEKNRREAERWFQSKAEVLQTKVTTSYTEIKTSQTDLTDLERTYQSREIELQGVFTMIQNLEQSLAEVGRCYAAQLSQLQLQIDHLQEELQKLNANIRQQALEYQLLLDIKMRLELEIAEYRRLLDGEAETTQPVDTYNPHKQRKVKVIVENLVDGEVVSSSVKENIEEIS